MLSKRLLLVYNVVFCEVLLPLMWQVFFWFSWFGLNRWFVRAFSCEWGGSISSSNDRGSRTPPLCTCRATGWTVRWVGAAPFRKSWLQLYPPPFIFPAFLCLSHSTFLGHLSFPPSVSLLKAFPSVFVIVVIWKHSWCVRSWAPDV